MKCCAFVRKICTQTEHDCNRHNWNSYRNRVRGTPQKRAIRSGRKQQRSTTWPLTVTCSQSGSLLSVTSKIQVIMCHKLCHWNNKSCGKMDLFQSLFSGTFSKLSSPFSSIEQNCRGPFCLHPPKLVSWSIFCCGPEFYFIISSDLKFLPHMQYWTNEIRRLTVGDRLFCEQLRF